MKLEKIYSGSNSNRTASGVELINQFTFGNKFPKRFVPGSLYTSGDYVYVINKDGTSSIYQCLVSGVYDTIDTVHWASASIDTTIQLYIDRILGLTGDNKYIVDFDYDVYVTEELTVQGRRITLPNNVTDHTQYILFADGKYISSDLGEFNIVRKNHLTYIDVTSDFNSIILYTMTPKNHNAELITISDVRPSSISTGDTSISIYVPFEVLGRGDYSLNLYMRGEYVLPSNYQMEYNESSGKLALVFTSESSLVSLEREDYTISVIYSRSRYIHIKKNEVTLPVSTEIGKYRLDTSLDFELGDCPLAFYQNTAIPSNVLHVSNESVSVTDKSYYGDIGYAFTLIGYTFLVDQEAPITDDFIVVDQNEREIPIPLVNYKAGESDIMVFRKQGSYVNTSRYYQKDAFIYLYDHETSITDGDCLLFRTVNNDEYVSMVSRFGEVRSDLTVSLPEDITDDNFLLFANNGTYIGKDQYQVVYGVVELSSSANVQPGDIVEYVFARYNKPYTSTIVKIGTTVASEDNKFPLPIQMYNPNTDDVLVFNSTTGLYVDSSRYSISSSGVVTVESGSNLNPRDQIDVYVLRNLASLIYTSSIPYIYDFI